MSYLKIRIYENLGLVPPVIGYLASIPKNGLSHIFYRLRHPGGIFNTQFGSAISDLHEIVKYLNGLKTEQIYGNDWESAELIRKFTLSLYSFTNFVNSAYEIILGCCREENNKPDKELWAWLKEHNYNAGKKYYAEISELRETLDILNELKHSSTSFGLITMQRIVDSTNVFGYYLAAVDENGSISPHQKYHPKINGEHTGTSFSRRLRIMYYGIYKASDVLLSALKLHFQQVYNFELNFNDSRKENNKVANELFEQINKLPTALFPYEKSIPIARKIKRATENYLIFENQQIFTPLSGYSIMAHLPLTDGFSRSWGIPYFKGENSK